jgi:tight adherence protein B
VRTSLTLTLVAALAAAAALALVPPVRPRLPPSCHRPDVGRLRPLAMLVALPLLPWLPAGWLVPGAVVSGATGASWLLWLRRRERRAADAARLRVLETCGQLAAELASGQPPAAALAQAADDWAELRPVAEAFRVGADVPAALRTLARRPGLDDLRLLAAAWQIAHRTGQGLAEAVERVARQLVAARATRRVVDGELASARATARLVALLPVAALAMGTGVGGEPVRFLLRSPPGWLCLALGLTFGLGGLAWIEALARDVDRGP